MARSSYVYVVQNDEGMPYKAFTVKHELVTYLRRLGGGVEDLAGVVRMRDGLGDSDATDLDIAELLAGGTA